MKILENTEFGDGYKTWNKNKFSRLIDVTITIIKLSLPKQGAIKELMTTTKIMKDIFIKQIYLTEKKQK